MRHAPSSPRGAHPRQKSSKASRKGSILLLVGICRVGNVPIPTSRSESSCVCCNISRRAPHLEGKGVGKLSPRGDCQTGSCGKAPSPGRGNTQTMGKMPGHISRLNTCAALAACCAALQIMWDGGTLPPMESWYLPPPPSGRDPWSSRKWW